MPADELFTPYKTFTNALKKHIEKKPDLIQRAMANVFSMRMLGNKTHGDLAEVAFAEFIKEHLDGYDGKHVGKDLFRAKSNEEDVLVTTPDGVEIPVSLKAYGVGPLQLSTNKESTMFPHLQAEIGENTIVDPERVKAILLHEIFNDFHNVNVLPLIYDEKKMRFNIMVFNAELAFQNATIIRYVSSGSGRKHPIYRFESADNGYIVEVRYGAANANALQRGLWTHTRNASTYFESLTGWMSYQINAPLLQLMAKILISTKEKHEQILEDF